MTWSNARCSLRLGAVMLMLGSIGCSDDGPTDADDPPVLLVSASTAGFSTLAGAPAPAAQVVNVTNGGEGVLGGLSASTAYGAGQPTDWLVAMLSATTAPATLTIAANAASLDPGSYSATITIAATGGIESKTVDATLEVSAGEPPTIVITSPVRATMIEQAGASVQITGEACHDSVPITGLAVNGSSIAVTGTNLCESFSVMQSSAWGLSLITVDATNAYGRRANVVQSYLLSPSFHIGLDDPAMIAHGIYVQLNQRAIDDGNRNDSDDIATLTEDALPTADWIYANLPNRLLNMDVLQTDGPFNPCTDELEIFKTSLTWKGPYILWIDAASLLQAWVRIEDLSLGLRVSYTGCLGNTTTVNATYRASVIDSYFAMVAKAWADSVQVDFQPTGVSIHSQSIEISQGAFIAQVMQAIANAASLHIGNTVTGLIEAATGQTASAALANAIESFGFDEVTQVNGTSLAVRATIDSVDHRADAAGRGIGVRLKSRFAPGVPPVGPAPARGAIRVAMQGEHELPSTGPALGVSVKLDAINQLLWSAWRARAFDTDNLAGQIGGVVAGIGGSVTALLPPVITAGTGSHAFEIGWGDLEISAVVDPELLGRPPGGDVPLHAYASARIGISPGWNEAGRHLDIVSITPEVHVQVNGPDELLDADDVTAALENAIEALLAKMAASAIEALPIPTLAMGGFSLGFQDVVVGRNDNFLTLTAVLMEP